VGGLEVVHVVIPGQAACGIERLELGRPDPQEVDQHQRRTILKREQARINAEVADAESQLATNGE
jgi:hypothetical protein